MIVEFVGLPGSGKTTLQERGMEKLKSLGVPLLIPAAIGRVYQTSERRPAGGPVNLLLGLGGQMRFALERVLCRIAAILDCPQAVGIVLRQMLVSRRSLNDKLYGMRLFWVALGNRWYFRKHAQSNQVVLLDEGVVQRAFTLFVDGHSKVEAATIAHYAEVIPLPDVLVYLKASPEVVLDRIGNRDRGLPPRFNHLNPLGLRMALVNAGNQLDILVEVIKTTTRTPVALVTLVQAANDVKNSVWHLVPVPVR